VGNCLAAALVGRWEGEFGPAAVTVHSTPALAHGATEPARRAGA
jgi:hypothetical protein